MAQNNNYIKVTKKYLIKYFAFCYNSIYRVYKDAKYGVEYYSTAIKQTE